MIDLADIDEGKSALLDSFLGGHEVEVLKIEEMALNTLELRSDL